MTILGNIIKSASNPVRVPQTALANTNSALSSGMFGTASSNLQINGMETSSWLFSVIDRISTGVAQTEWHLFAKKVGSSERTEVTKHIFLDFWAHVNDFYNHFEFTEAGSQIMELAGIQWWVFDLERGPTEPPNEMWVVRPDRMTMIKSKDQFLIGYLYRIGAYIQPLTTKEAMYIRRPDPKDAYGSLSVIPSLQPDIEAERNASIWLNNFFRNNAEPGGVIKVDHEMTTEEWDKFVLRWRSQHQGITNAHRVAVLEGGAEWQDVKFTQRDMQFDQLRMRNRDNILGAFGIPKSVLGIVEDVNRANAEVGDRTFAKWIIRPRLERMKAAINERLLPMFDPTGVLVFDYKDPTPENRDLIIAEANSTYASGLVTQNEGRSLLGWPKVTGGDEFIPTPAPAAALPSSTANRSFLREIAPPATTEDDPDSDDDEADFKGYRKKSGSDYPKPVLGAEKAMLAGWKGRLKTEGEELAKYLDSFKSVDLITDKVIVSLVKLELSDLSGYLWNWAAKYGKEVDAELRALFSASLLAELSGIPAATVQQYAEAYASYRGSQLLSLDGEDSVVATTRARVNEIISQGIANGLSTQDMANQLRDDFNFSPDRADMIARTESATALGHGQLKAAVYQGRDEKSWLTQGGGDDDEVCRLNEEMGWIAINSPFASGDDAIPAHPNCECVVQYRTSELAESARSVSSEIVRVSKALADEANKKPKANVTKMTYDSNGRIESITKTQEE